MASLFPGMDPYLEGPDWLDFHVVFITALRGALSRSLPSHYRTRIDERVNLIETRSYDRTLYKPDLSIERRPHGMAGAPAIQGAVGTVSRNRITLPLPAVEEIRETHIEISHKPSNKLVAIIEILSPWNKAGGAGNSEYLAKRRQVLRQPVHLIEIDLLMCGLRLPLDVPLPPADYYALVSRSDQRPNCEVYPWKLRESLPTLAVPLDAPDLDVAVDLQAVFEAAYETGGYGSDLQLHEGEPVGAAIPQSEKAWASQVVRSAGDNWRSHE